MWRMKNLSETLCLYSNMKKIKNASLIKVTVLTMKQRGDYVINLINHNSMSNRHDLTLRLEMKLTS